MKTHLSASENATCAEVSDCYFCLMIALCQEGLLAADCGASQHDSWKNILPGALHPHGFTSPLAGQGGSVLLHSPVRMKMETLKSYGLISSSESPSAGGGLELYACF